ncbi:MAG TPA: GvpL/GvpF family gas vesicle protein [Pseudonocardiaceae bacterium]|nr:GvpL/GvpF family gas vesicle protein [Pseudonocardiaceae bacterium]
MTLHLYAVVRAGTDLPEHAGVQGQALDVVRSGELAAVVSPVDPDIEATEADVLAHLDVITTLLGTGPVIPMRFGTIAPDTDAVRREVIDASSDEFTEHLRATSDVVEVLVTIQVDEDAALREVLSHDPGFGSASPGAGSMAERIALGEDIAGRLAAAVREWSDELVRGACGHAEAVAPLDTPEHTTARFALLVRRDRLDSVDAELRRLPAAAGQGGVPYDVEYVGPLPPLDFPLQSTVDTGGSSLWGW